MDLSSLLYQNRRKNPLEHVEYPSGASERDAIEENVCLILQLSPLDFRKYTYLAIECRDRWSNCVVLELDTLSSASYWINRKQHD